MPFWQRSIKVEINKKSSLFWKQWLNLYSPEINAKDILHGHLEHLWAVTPMLLFKCLVSIASFAVVLFCSPVNKSTNSLAHISKPGLLRHWQSPWRTLAVRLIGRRKQISLLYSSEDFETGTFLHFSGTGITNSSHSLCFSPSTKYPRAEQRMLTTWSRQSVVSMFVFCPWWHLAINGCFLF